MAPAILTPADKRVMIRDRREWDFVASFVFEKVDDVSLNAK